MEGSRGIPLPGCPEDTQAVMLSMGSSQIDIILYLGIFSLCRYSEESGKDMSKDRLFKKNENINLNQNMTNSTEPFWASSSKKKKKEEEEEEEKNMKKK